MCGESEGTADLYLPTVENNLISGFVMPGVLREVGSDTWSNVEAEENLRSVPTMLSEIHTQVSRPGVQIDPLDLEWVV